MDSNKLLIVVESSTLLKKFLKNAKIESKSINNLEFLSTNGSIYKYKNQLGKYKYNTINKNIENKIKYSNKTIIIATDNDQNGNLIALEIISLNKNALRFNLNFDSIINNNQQINEGFFIKNSSKTIDYSSSTHYVSKKIKETIENKEFYLKTGLNMSIDDRIIMKLMTKKMKYIIKQPEWNIKKGKDLYLFLASALELNKNINEIYNKLEESFINGEVSYFRTDGISHQYLELYNNIELLNEILKFDLDIIFKKLSSNEIEVFTNNIFILMKVYNIGSPSILLNIFNKFNQNVDFYIENNIEDDIDVNRRINEKTNSSSNKKINISDFDFDLFINKINELTNNKNIDKNIEFEIEKEIDLLFS